MSPCTIYGTRIDAESIWIDARSIWITILRVSAGPWLQDLRENAGELTILQAHLGQKSGRTIKTLYQNQA